MVELYEKDEQGRQMLAEKWSPILEADDCGIAPIKNKELKGITAQLLENQEKWLNENQTIAGDLAVFTPVLIPTVRRIAPSLISNELVGIQPMKMPTGYAYAWRVGYGGDGTNTVSNLTAPLHRTNTPTAYTAASVVVTVDGDITGNGMAVGDLIADTVTTGANPHGTLIYMEYTDGFTKMLIQYGLTGTQPTATITNPIVAGDNVYAENEGTGYQNAIVVVDVINNEIMHNLILKDYLGPVSTATGETLDNSNMKTIRTSMERSAVEAVTRKLKAEYTIEMAQDLKAVHGMDAEAELMNVLQYEVAAEIDSDIIRKINDNATSTTGWIYGTAAAAVIGTPGTADGQWEMERFRTLFTKAVKESNRIAVTSRRGPGNFIICSSNASTALSGLSNFMYSSVGGSLQAPNGGVQKVGTLDGRFSVYVDTYALSDYVTVGYKGPGTMDSGIVYCPYIPLQMQKIVHEDTFQPAIGVMTRDAICYNMQGTNNFYRKFATTFTGSQLA